MEEDRQEEVNDSLQEHKDLVVPPVTSHLGNPTETYHEAEGFTSDDEDSAIPTKSPPTPDPVAGIGYWESPGNSPKLIRKWSPKICGSVQSAIAAFKEDILSMRHGFPTGILMDAAKKELPGTDEDTIKSEIEVQVLDLLNRNGNIDSKLQPHTYTTKLRNGATLEPKEGDDIKHLTSVQMADAVNEKILYANGAYKPY